MTVYNGTGANVLYRKEWSSSKVASRLARLLNDGSREKEIVRKLCKNITLMPGQLLEAIQCPKGRLSLCRSA